MEANLSKRQLKEHSILNNFLASTEINDEVNPQTYLKEGRSLSVFSPWRPELTSIVWLLSLYWTSRSFGNPSWQL